MFGISLCAAGSLGELAEDVLSAVAGEDIAAFDSGCAQRDAEISAISSVDS